MPVVSFDFDGVLHRSMWPGTSHPLSFTDSDLEPREDMHARLREEAQDHDIIVVTARDMDNEGVVWEFIERYGLPVQEVFCTQCTSKLPYLQKAGAIRHYDDTADIERYLEGSDIEFVHVPY